MSIETRIAELMGKHKEELARMVAEMEAAAAPPAPAVAEPADEQPAAA